MVPDIDDEDNPYKNDESKNSRTPAVTPGTSDLEKRLVQLQSDIVLEPKNIRSATRRRREPPQPSLHRLNVDAEPLSSSDFNIYKHLIPRQYTERQ